MRRTSTARCASLASTTGASFAPRPNRVRMPRSASSPDSSVAEVEVECCRCDEQRSPPNAPIAQIGPEAEQPDTDTKAHAGDCVTVTLRVCVHSFHAFRTSVGATRIRPGRLLPATRLQRPGECDRDERALVSDASRSSARHRTTVLGTARWSSALREDA